MTVKPNAAHYALTELEDKYDVTIITQNIDDLHERAGSSDVVHLHGELLKARSSVDETLVMSWDKDILTGDLCEKKSQLRPHVVWFGEAVPMIEVAMQITTQADYIVIIGTSMQVYPAASLMHYAKNDARIFFIDPRPSINPGKNLEVIAENATVGVPIVVAQLLNI